MKSLVVLALIAGSAASLPALATQTNIGLLDGAGREAGVGSILNAITGAGITNAQGNNTSFGSGLITRVDDLRDELFQDGALQVTFTALYWGNDPGNANSDAHRISLINSSGNAVLGPTQVGPGGLAVGGIINATTTASDNPMHFFIQRIGAGANFDADSRHGANVGSTDRMITFDLTDWYLANHALTNINQGAVGGSDQAEVGLSSGSNISILQAGLDHGKRIYAHFVETGSDNDFNDLVFLSQGLTIVPLPTAALGSMAGLGALAVVRRRRLA